MPTASMNTRRRGKSLRDVAAAAAAGALLSGAPSTAWALACDGDPLEAARAAGAIVVGERAPAGLRLAAGVPVHAAVSLGWAAVLARVLPARRAPAWGALAGLGIAALDLGIAGRRLPAISRLALAPQLADHLAFGAIVGAALTWRPGHPRARQRRRRVGI